MCSGSLEAVEVLVEAGAEMGTKDSAWGGTPLGWAEHYLSEGQGNVAANSTLKSRPISLRTTAIDERTSGSALRVISMRGPARPSPEPWRRREAEGEREG